MEGNRKEIINKKTGGTWYSDQPSFLVHLQTVVPRAEPKAKINTIVAIPYNPYEPKPYMRWTMRGMLDLDKELRVAHEFWDFIGGKGTYQDLLDCFEKVGVELRPEIDKYFSKFSGK